MDRTRLDSGVMAAKVLAMLSPHDRDDLAEMAATPEEVEWAARAAYIVDPGTDSPAMKLLQRRRAERAEREKVKADRLAESPLSKFARVWAA